MNDLQATFDFPEIKEKVSFEVYTGKCSCGHEYTSNRCSIALEMIITCPSCGDIIRIGDIKKGDI